MPNANSHLIAKKKNIKVFLAYVKHFSLLPLSAVSGNQLDFPNHIALSCEKYCCADWWNDILFCCTKFSIKKIQLELLHRICCSCVAIITEFVAIFLNFRCKIDLPHVHRNTSNLWSCFAGSSKISVSQIDHQSGKPSIRFQYLSKFLDIYISIYVICVCICSILAMDAV